MKALMDDVGFGEGGGVVHLRNSAGQAAALSDYASKSISRASIDIDVDID
jgi:hypothetical protein